jgi:hypothetical protein
MAKVVLVWSHAEILRTAIIRTERDLGVKNGRE